MHWHSVAIPLWHSITIKHKMIMKKILFESAVLELESLISGIKSMTLCFALIGLMSCNHSPKPEQIITQQLKDSIFNYYIDAALYDSAKITANKFVKEEINQINQTLYLKYSFVTSMCGFPDFRERQLREDNTVVRSHLKGSYELFKECFKNDSAGNDTWFNKLKFDCNADSIKILSNPEMTQKTGMYCVKFHNRTFFLIANNTSESGEKTYRLQMPELNEQGLCRVDWSIYKRRYEIIE